MTISRRIFLKMKSILDKVVEKIKIHILCQITFFRKSCRVRDNVEKFGGARKAADGNMAALSMLDN
jgi:hypothetical protein